MTSKLFSNKDLVRMIVPLFFEQFLLMLVGLADTFFISQAGEAAVAGVSLTNQFNTVFIFLFTALAAGGAVVVSQYVGTGDADRASEAASQLLMFSIVFSVAMSVVVLLLRRQLLGLMFGRVEPAVMDACVIYLGISALSYPALAVYNAGAATFRSIGKTSVTMVVSIISNAVNVVGNYIGIFVLHAGVAGVAWPSLLARMVSAVLITWLVFREERITYRLPQIMRWNGPLLAKIAGIEDLKGYAAEMFHAGSNLEEKTAEEIFYQDFKKFSMNDIKFGVGQINSMNSDELLEIGERLQHFMEETIATTGLQMLFFMMTDIVKESSYLIYMGNGAKELIESSFNVTPNYGMFVLKGVVSRKKQLIPAIMADLQQ